MPYWTCETCQARLYSASEPLRWKDCPVCEGNLVMLREHPAGEPGRNPGGAASRGRPGAASADGR